MFAKWAGAALLIITAPVSAEPAFEVNGLHVHLLFPDALARVRQSGATCQLGTLRRGIFARCAYRPCIEGEPERVCDDQNRAYPAPEIASQRITDIGLEAPDNSALLTRIFIVFDGSVTAVAEQLKQQFGPPLKADDPATTGGTWTHSRRLHWEQGRDHMGLLDTANTISLTIDPRQQGASPGDN